MADFLLVNARIVSLRQQDSAGPRRGAALLDLGVIERGFIRVSGSTIAELGEGDPPDGLHTRVIDARGRVVTPGFVDCHTHACFEGERLDEWEMKVAGRSYLDIQASGGGIMASVMSVRGATTESLTQGVLRRTREMAQYGTTTVEVKSGYGLDTTTELRMLDAITAAALESPLRILPTFLGAHAKVLGDDGFVERTIEETLPRVASAFPGLSADAYCEAGAWSVEECVGYFTKAKSLGLGVRVHTDQFNSLGMIPRAIELGASSVDHLEAATDEDLARVARSSTIAVGLPAASFCLATPCLRARAFVDMGGALALATNANPGSAPVRAMPLIIAFAVREMRMLPAEALVASTWNAACALKRESECGSLERGKSADLVLWPHTDERAIGYEIAGALPLLVMARGNAVVLDETGIR